MLHVGTFVGMTPVEPPSQGLNAAVAARLQAERAALGLTVEQLARLSDVPYASLRRYLKAERDIDVATLGALCEVLRISPDALVRDAIARSRSDYVLAADAGDPEQFDDEHTDD
jgi:transcriptional regulator with XRE-family HTH domain